LEQDNDFFINLFERLRKSGEEEALQCFRLIRSSASLDEIRQNSTQNHNPNALQEETLANLKSPSEVQKTQFTKKDTRRIMDLRRLTDIPLYNVPAHPWTSITDDDQFVSHLISLYFTWVNPALNLINRDLFINDMMSGKAESRYCSPLLVNAMLAEACVS
jgi:hypothetical protein